MKVSSNVHPYSEFHQNWSRHNLLEAEKYFFLLHFVLLWQRSNCKVSPHNFSNWEFPIKVALNVRRASFVGASGGSDFYIFISEFLILKDLSKYFNAKKYEGVFAKQIITSICHEHPCQLLRPWQEYVFPEE